jgi:hypothetical protein
MRSGRAGHSLAAACFEVADDDACAFPRECHRRRTTDTTSAAAGDECDLSVQTPGHPVTRSCFRAER